MGTDKGHEHNLKLKIPFPVLEQGNELGDGNGNPKWATAGHYPPFTKQKSPVSKANIQNGHSQISTGYAQLSGVVNGRAAKETRPKNVKYPFIMKINDKNCDDYHISEVSSVVGWLPQK